METLSENERKILQVVMEHPFLRDLEEKAPFIRKLALENGWSRNFALRAVREYQRFIFLCLVTEEPVTPSDAVDYVWHAHILHTEDYIDRFCASLGVMIHHTPDTAGTGDMHNYVVWYENTKQLYKHCFGVDASVDIWPPFETYAQDRIIHVKRGTSWSARFAFFLLRILNT